MVLGSVGLSAFRALGFRVLGGFRVYRANIGFRVLRVFKSFRGLLGYL